MDSTTFPPATLAAVVARLRASGCVFAEDEADLLVDTAADDDALDVLVGRRAAGEPLEVVVGWAEFRGLRVGVDAGVFVPRRRTELLAVQATTLARPGAVVLDLCCGTGAVGLAVATAVPGVELHAADLDPAAVRCARRNVGPRGRVHAGDLFAALPADLRGRVDVLAANAPYVPTDAVALMPPEAREHEPRVALDGGDDGLDVARRVVTGAPDWLRPGGTLLVETSDRQAPALSEAFARNGFTPRTVTDDERGGTVVVGSQE